MTFTLETENTRKCYQAPFPIGGNEATPHTHAHPPPLHTHVIPSTHTLHTFNLYYTYFCSLKVIR